MFRASSCLSSRAYQLQKQPLVYRRNVVVAVLLVVVGPLFAASGLHTHVVTGRSPHVYINPRLQTQFRAPDDERYAARNMLSLQ